MLILAAMAVGAVIPAQTAVNSRLRTSVGAPLPTSFYSFTVAFLCAVTLAVAISGFRWDFAAAAAEPWWVWIGGVMGTVFLTGNVLLFPRLGSVETVVIPILGQVIMALVIDQFGIFGAPQTEASALRLLGAVVVLAGIVCIHVLRHNSDGAIRSHAGGGSLWGWRAFGVFMGMCSATQTAANGYLGTVLGSSIQAGAVNLAVGATLLFLLSLTFRSSRQALLSTIEPGPWWMWLGGVFGAIFVVGMATLAPIIGTGATVIGQLAGTIICGQVIERFGFFGSPKTPLHANRVVGLVLVFIGAVLVRAL
ncbi:DMT family transporter [Corynebacterium tuscaniense]|uniref:DMT family transporter n=1 Tax=Corynebacterium tuscaniense TaxID=302449 RepID=UPI001238EE37|nr:DMT family transporter [Corynebacterium tuscaniense]KAA8746795.1 DMT family transporter [Corynebacterium tuscaniense]